MSWQGAPAGRPCCPRKAPQTPSQRPFARVSLVVAVLTSLLHAFAAEPQLGVAPGARPGYLISLRLQGTALTVLSVAAIENYLENKHIAVADDWRVVLLDRAGREVGTRAIGNPYRVSPVFGDDRPIRLTIRIPAIPALAAVVVQDRHFAERLRIPVDEAFRGRAAAERARFLAHDRENRRLLAEAAARRAGRPRQSQAASRSREPARLETLPAEVRDRVLADTAEEMEALIRFGPETLNAARALSVLPEQVAVRPAAAPALLGPAAAQAGVPTAGPFTVTGRVTDAAAGTPLVNARITVMQYTSSPVYVSTTVVYTDAAGRYTCDIAAGYIRVNGPYLPAGTYVEASWWTAVSGNLIHDIQARHGVTLSGHVTNQAGEGMAGVTVQWHAASNLFGDTRTDASGAYTLLVPVNTPFTFTVTPPVPYVTPAPQAGVVLSADSVRDVALARGFVVQGVVAGDGGAPVLGASVLVRQLVPTSSNPPSWSQWTQSGGRYALVLPQNLFPNDVILSVYANGYLTTTTALTIDGDVTHDVALARGVTLTGVVTDSAGAPQPRVRVRALRGGTLALSTETDGAGAYALTLEPGTYDLSVIPPAGGPLAPATAANVVVGGSTTRNFTLPPAGATVTLKLYCGVTYSTCSLFARLELYQNGRTVAAFLGLGAGGVYGWDSSARQYYFSRSFSVVPGRYDAIVYMLGLAPVHVAGVQVTGASTLTAVLPAPHVWSGTLRGADGTPIAGAWIGSFDDTTTMAQTLTTDAAGRFSIWMTPRGFVRFSTNEGSRNILYTERFGEVTSSRTADCVQDVFPVFTDAGSTLTQMYGVTDRGNRWNLVMLGDGYTDVEETYTDTNGNGQWDGVLYVDINRNGVWENSEPYRISGTAAAPVAGTDPTPANEPFVDLNGDGVLSTDDQALFDRNTLDTARSLFGQDVWRSHRDTFNIFRIRVVSEQTGQDLLDTNGNVVIDRHTALGTYLAYPESGYQFGNDGALEDQYINEYLPEADTRIVLVNQPVRMGRATASFGVQSHAFTYGGHLSDVCNDGVISHELAHAVGQLLDEYEGVPGAYSGPELAAANVTTVSDPDAIPWKSMLTAGKEIPSVPGSGGVGLFEGGWFRYGGVYRPTTHCALRMGVRYCPVCTRELEVRFHDIGVPIPVATPLSPVNAAAWTTPTFTWQRQAGVTHYLLEVENATTSELLVTMDVYDTSFTLTSPLAPGTYRWRIRAGSTANWAEWSAWSTFTAAPSLFFADDPLQPGVTFVRAAHLAELRQAVAVLRARFGLRRQTWSEAEAGAGTPIRAAQVAEVRTALAEVYAAAGRTPPSYTRPVLVPRQSVISAIDIVELREALRAIW